MAALTDERGETLVELLLTIMVTAIGVVAIVAAIGGSVLASDTHRQLAEGEVVARDYGDAVKQKAIQLPAYTTCPSNTDLAPAYTPAAGWTAQIATVEYWVPDVATFPNGVWSAPDDPSGCASYYTTCGNAISACDAGLQRVTFNVVNARTGAAATSLTARVLVRRNNAP